MLEEGRKINGLNYIDVDNDLSDRLNDIIDRWHDLNQSFDLWYQDVMEAEDNFKQWDTMMGDFTSKFVTCHQDNPLPTELDPSKLKCQVVEKQVSGVVTTMTSTKIWAKNLLLKCTITSIQ